MKTPKEYNALLQEKKITTQMLSDCLYSVNKRAKNYRDRERNYREYYRNTGFRFAEQCRLVKEQFYRQKDILLSIVKPKEIHRIFHGYERIRIYEYDPEYVKYMNQFVWENCFWDEEIGTEIWFGDIEDKTKPRYEYLLFYDLGTHSFHSPIQNPKHYDLEIKPLDHLHTSGADFKELISCQFIRKVIALIESEEYEYIDSQTEEKMV